MTILKTTNGLNGYRPELVKGYAPEFSELSILCSQPKSEKVIKSGKKQYPGNLSESTEKARFCGGNPRGN